MRAFRWLTAATLLFTACSRPAPAPQAPARVDAAATAQPAEPVAPPPPTAAQPQPAEQALFVDVRTPQEYAAGHVAGALNIPHDQMQARWRELEAYRDRPVVLYCHSGRRAGLALQVLQAEGFSQVQNGGGLQGLLQQGLPLER